MEKTTGIKRKMSNEEEPVEKQNGSIDGEDSPEAEVPQLTPETWRTDHDAIPIPYSTTLVDGNRGRIGSNGCVIPSDFDQTKHYRVFADGIFDLFHFGHAKALEQAKTLFPNCTLVVGVNGDKDTHSLKGKTVMSEDERVESVRHCKWVDEVVCPSPWIVDTKFLEKHKIDFVVHDPAPYPSGDVADVYDFVKNRGQFIATARTDGISTSDLINRIVRDYDEFVFRNLKRGYKREELNVGFIKEKSIRISHSMKDVGDKLKHLNDEVIKKPISEIKTNVQSNVEEIGEKFKEWSDLSSKRIEDFLKLFRRDGKMNKYLQEKRRKVSDNFKNFAKNTTM